MLNLQHDGHNDLDRIASVLRMLDDWKKIYSDATKEVKVPNSSCPYVVAEYLRTHIEKSRKILNEMYIISKKLSDGKQ